MLRKFIIVLLLSISLECKGDSFSPEQIKSLVDTLTSAFGAIFDLTPKSNEVIVPHNPLNQRSKPSADAANPDPAQPVKSVSSGSVQKIADKQGDGNYNQNINLHDNKGTLNLSSTGRFSDHNYGNYAQTALRS